jgi:hypothetical protein
MVIIPHFLLFNYCYQAILAYHASGKKAVIDERHIEATAHSEKKRKEIGAMMAMSSITFFLYSRISGKRAFNYHFALGMMFIISTKLTLFVLIS